MHEMSLCRSILEIATDVSAKHGDAEVLTIRLAVGAFDHIDDEALRFAFQILGEGTICGKAALNIEHKPFVGLCASCARRFETRELSGSCPACGESKLSWDGESGMEVLTVDLAVS